MSAVLTTRLVMTHPQDQPDLGQPTAEEPTASQQARSTTDLGGPRRSLVSTLPGSVVTQTVSNGTPRSRRRHQRKSARTFSRCANPPAVVGWPVCGRGYGCIDNGGSGAMIPKSERRPS